MLRILDFEIFKIPVRSNTVVDNITMHTEENKKIRLTALLATGVIGTFLLGSSTFLYIDNHDLRKDIKVKKEQIETLSSAIAKLQTELHDMEAGLSRLRGKNQELDNLLASADKELEERKDKINKLIRQNASLSKFRKEAEELRKLKQVYLVRIDNLEKKVEELTAENSSLRDDNQRLMSELESVRNNYIIMERKVEIASILKVVKVEAVAEKKVRSGKYSKVSSSKKADRIEINFELSENRAAEAGAKTVYLRILDPTGKVLSAPASEKGFFTNHDGNLELPYSLKKEINYNNQKIKTKAIYEVGNQDLQDGAYTIEFFCEGYFCGASKYILK